MTPCFIAVHAGAGYHSPSNAARYRSVMMQACNAAMEALESGAGCVEAAEAAIVALEDSPWTNAGNGSNLTIDGTVECDASIMSGSGTFGAIAAAPGIQNPIQAATRLLKDSLTPLSHGRVRPLMLGGDAAREWAVSVGLQGTATTREEAAKMHVTDRTRKQYKKYLGILNAGSNNESVEQTDDTSSSKAPRGKRRKVDTFEGDLLNDTVGCVIVDANGRVAAGVSSGGIALKLPGRVGEAALFGAGCWAQDSSSSYTQARTARTARTAPPPSSSSERGAVAEGAVAISVTGVGERVMQHLVAREMAQRVMAASSQSDDTCTHSRVADACEEYLRCTVLSGPAPKECGILCASATTNGSSVSVELVAAHGASQTMAVAYLMQGSDNHRSSEAMILRREDLSSDDVQTLTFGATSWEIPLET